MHPKILETEQPVQGFFCARGEDQNRRIFWVETKKRKEVIDDQRIQSREK
jgi:hypothetical protein